MLSKAIRTFQNSKQKKSFGDAIKNVISTMDLADDEQYQIGKTWPAEAGDKSSIAPFPCPFSFKYQIYIISLFMYLFCLYTLIILMFKELLSLTRGNVEYFYSALKSTNKATAAASEHQPFD